MRLPYEIRQGLSRRGDHPSGWYLITGDEAHYNLRAGEQVRLFHQTSKGWEPLKSLDGRNSREEVLAFRRRERPGATAGGCQGPVSKTRQPPAQIQPPVTHAEPEPAVTIQHPARDAVIALDDYSHGRRQLEWYTFQPGETAESVTRRFLGYPDPNGVFDNQMRVVKDPEPGKRYRVLTSHLLNLKGSVRDSAQVQVSWSGPTSGRDTLTGSADGTASWKSEIPVKTGRYQVTVKIAEGPQEQIDFEVVDNPGSLWARTFGMAKEVINQVVSENNALKHEWFAESGIFSYTDQQTGQTLTSDEVAELYRDGTPPLLKPDGADEAAGAQAVRDFAQTPALIAAITALGSRGRSALRHPDEFFEDITKALTHSRSETEALGELGMHQAHRRLGIETDPRYVNRYHGPDNIGINKHKNDRMAETETKGSQDDQVRVAKDTNKNRQGSPAKNLQRAKRMKKKELQGKVGQPSNRQGGPYLESEMELYDEIRRKKGNKQHLLVHTNTTTGKVRTFDQIDGGKIGDKLDEFEIENFDEAKAVIQKHFEQIKGQ